MKRWLPWVLLAMVGAWVPLLWEGSDAPVEPEVEPSGDEGPVEPPVEPPVEQAAQLEPTTPSQRAPEPAVVQGEDSADGPEPPDAPANPIEPGMPTLPIELLSRRFVAERRDALWANDAEPRLESLYDEADIPPGTVKSVECRTTICVLEVGFSLQHHKNYTALYGDIRKEFGNEISFNRHSNDPDPVTGLIPVQVYVLRRGYELDDLKD